MTATAILRVTGHLSSKQDCIRKDEMAMQPENSLRQSITSGYKQRYKVIYKET